MDDVAQDDIINVSERGDRAFIGIHPDRMMDHAWAGNVVDLCPVGSLLSKDTLHKARAWELDKTPSVCTSCSQGCSINIDTRNGVVVRLRPRPNAEVNQYFICDHGRRNYRWMNRGDRIDAPLVSAADGLAAADWDTAIAEAARMIRGAGGKAVLVASASASNEALFMAKHLLSDFDLTSVFRVERVDGEQPLAAVENLALREERAANVAGAVALGYREEFDAGLASIAESAVVIVLDESLDGVDGEVLAASPDVIYLGTVLPAQARSASVVLPIANVAEEDGSFVNRDGRVQRYLQAKSAPGMARPAWWVFGELLSELGRGEALSGVDEAFALMAEHEPGFKGLSHPALGLHGALAPETSTANAAR
jgi:NADH-quinone oxidoreductase subunit G